MSKTTAWLLLIGGVIVSILVEDALYEMPEFIADAVAGVGILGTMGYINKKK